MAWLYLVLAGLCEIAWAIGLKKSDNFKHFGWSAWTVVIMILSFILLARAMSMLPAGTSYAVWTGIGAVGTTILGIVLFQESRDPVRLACIGLIILGIIGLKWFTPASG